MTRLSSLATSALLVLALLPAAAQASHPHKRRHHHARTHHARVHVERFGHAAASSSAATSSTSDTGATTPPAPAGTVSSFTGGVLTIALSDGSSISGTVTNATEIECQMANGEDNGSNDFRTADRGPGGGDDNGDNGSGDGSPGGGSDDGAMTSEGASCGMSALTPGVVVQDARLAISGTGSIWQRMDIAR